MNGTPIADKELARVMRMTALSTVGVAVSPHLFRTSALASVANFWAATIHILAALFCTILIPT